MWRVGGWGEKERRVSSAVDDLEAAVSRSVQVSGREK